jgi:hypothetical protein
MIRLGTLFWLVLVSATGFAMFGVKYQVQSLEDELARTDRAIMAEEHEIRVLDAEWAYLTRPETLEAINRQYLSLAPISTKQLRTTVAEIPMRPVPLPPAAAPTPVEAATAVAVAEPPSEPPPLPAAPASPPDGMPPASAAPTPLIVMPEPSPAQSAPQVMPASLEKPAGPSQFAKAVPVKAVLKPNPPRRAKSLDDLISQILASR